VTEILKHSESGSVKEISTSLQDAGTVENKAVMNIDTCTPAIQTGGRDSLPLRQTVASASPSALDLIKKKLQDAGASSAPSPLATPSAASELNGSKPADAAPKGQQASSNGEKSKDNNGDGNISDSSSDSDDEERGPSKEDCIRQFKVIIVAFLLDSRDTEMSCGHKVWLLLGYLLSLYCSPISTR
jgi:transcription elongation regulator 1